MAADDRRTTIAETKSTELTNVQAFVAKPACIEGRWSDGMGVGVRSKRLERRRASRNKNSAAGELSTRRTSKLETKLFRVLVGMETWIAIQRHM